MKAKLFVATLRVRTTYMGNPQVSDVFVGVYRVKSDVDHDEVVRHASRGRRFHRMTIAKRTEHIRQCLVREGYTRVDADQVIVHSSY